MKRLPFYLYRFMTTVRMAYSQCLLGKMLALTKPSTATAFPLQLRLHFKAVRVGGVSEENSFVQLDGKSLTTPESIDLKVASFCRSLSSETPVYVEVHPEPWCRQSCCEMNVDRLIEKDGGEKVVGYKIWYKKNKYIEAERHVVWKKDGALIDPTFNTDGEEKVLFLPDTNASKGYEDRPMKVRKGFTQKSRLFAKQLDENDRNIVRMSNEESWERMLSYEDWLAGKRMPNMWREPSR